MGDEQESKKRGGVTSYRGLFTSFVWPNSPGLSLPLSSRSAPPYQQASKYLGFEAKKQLQEGDFVWFVCLLA
jgi:hypothetical protein